VIAAMRARPFLIGGTERFDTVMLEETDGQILTKVGAEGVHCGAIPEEDLGFALKVEDGGQRAQYSAVVLLLQRLALLGSELPERLGAFLESAVLNTRGERVGTVGPLA
jgi:L-asparaginase II